MKDQGDMAQQRSSTAPPDAGFSLVEVVIAMFVFALVAVAILPAAVGAIRLSTVNEDGAAANAAASALLAEFRAEFPDGGSNSCDDVTGFTPSADPSSYTLTVSPASCAGVAPTPSAPVLFTVTVTVTSEPSAAPVTMSTQIAVNAG